MVSECVAAWLTGPELCMNLQCTRPTYTSRLHVTSGNANKLMSTLAAFSWQISWHCILLLNLASLALSYSILCWYCVRLPKRLHFEQASVSWRAIVAYVLRRAHFCLYHKDKLSMPNTLKSNCHPLSECGLVKDDKIFVTGVGNIVELWRWWKTRKQTVKVNNWALQRHRLLLR